MTDITVTAAKVAKQADTKTRSFIAAETITAGQALYMLTTGTVGVADANSSGKEQFCGIALNGGLAGDAIEVAYFGPVEGFALSTVNCWAPLYLSDTAGALGDGAGSMTVRAGRVMAKTDNSTVASATRFLFVDVDFAAVAWS